MKIFYFLNWMGHKIGSVNISKIKHLANGKRVFECDISDFDGQLLGVEFL